MANASVTSLLGVLSKVTGQLATDCQTCWSEGLERVRYFPRQLITANDMLAEQEYFRQKLRRHNRFLHGWGVVCGLDVTAASTSSNPWLVRIGAGYALSPQGDEIYVGEDICFNMAACAPHAAPNPCEPSQPLPQLERSARVYLAIRYAECKTRPVRVHPVGCSCDEMDCEFTRIRDDFEVSCISNPHRDPVRELCDPQPPACLPCPEDPWVVLAQVTLPVRPTVPLVSGAIDMQTEFRRRLYSTVVVQQQVITCCCSAVPVPPLPVLEPLVVITCRSIAGRTITIKFNKKLNPQSVGAGTVLVSRVLDDGTKSHILGAVSISNSQDVLLFDLQGLTLPAGTYEVIVKATGADAISGSDGSQLDGDNNGKPGDDYIQVINI